MTESVYKLLLVYCNYTLMQYVNKSCCIFCAKQRLRFHACLTFVCSIERNPYGISKVYVWIWGIWFHAIITHKEREKLGYPDQIFNSTVNCSFPLTDDEMVIQFFLSDIKFRLVSHQANLCEDVDGRIYKKKLELWMFIWARRSQRYICVTRCFIVISWGKIQGKYLLLNV